MKSDTVTPGYVEANGPTESSRAFFPPLIGVIGVFFGGPLAAVALATLNARHLRRLEQDRRLLVLAALVAGATICGAAALALQFQARERAFRERFYLLSLSVALILWAALCFRQRTWTVRGALSKLNTWLIGLGVVVVSALVQLLLNAVVTLLLRGWA